ncbi:alpha/beta fold hydrolase [Cellulomonas sp. URHE0023]|uniref:alpha/beta fold hydrolase n=1 Tax=Cellulomonas sp. URHE0023 TaxID=1380354 RepID=UPI00048536F0|nr:alpha/beta hydrolase [Cellulomonas sp. URHE0023]
MSTVQFISRPEGRIAYTVHGTPDAPLVVLVPGMGDLRTAWRDVAGPLTDAGYRVACMDLRGHGDSDTTFATHGDVVTGQDIVALVEHLGGPAVVGGNSMGAASAAWAAAERPDLVAGLVLTGPLLRDPPASAAVTATTHGLVRVALGRPWGAALWARLYRTYFSRGTQSPWLDEHVADIKASLTRPGYLRSFRHLALQLTHAPVEARLGEVVAPTIAFLGTVDPDYKDPAAEALWLRSAIDAEVTLIPEVGHHPEHQAAKVVVDDTIAFLASLPRTGSAFAAEALA